MRYNNPDFESKDERVNAFMNWWNSWTMKNGKYDKELIL